MILPTFPPLSDVIFSLIGLSLPLSFILIVHYLMAGELEDHTPEPVRKPQSPVLGARAA